MRTGTKKLCEASIILALILVSQLFKNLSVFITGSIINFCLITCTLLVDKKYGILLSIVSPITAFLITGSPIMSALPIIILFVILGNIVFVLINDHFYKKKNPKSFVTAMVTSCMIKGLIMGVTIIPCMYLLLPEASPLRAVIGTLSLTFSAIQIITALIGTFLFAWCYNRLVTFLHAEDIRDYDKK